MADVVMRLCDHRGECVDINFPVKIDGRVIEIPLYRLEELIEQLGIAEEDLDNG